MSQPYDALVPELRDDPLSRGYAGMTDAEIVASLYVVDRPGPMKTRTPQEVYDALTVAEIAAIEAAALNEEAAQAYQAALAWLGYCQVAPSLDLTEGARGRVLLDGLVSAGIVSAASRTAVLAAAAQTVTRAQELEMGDVSTGHILSAREIINGNV